MENPEIAAGVVHDVPDDLKKVLIANTHLLAEWNKLTALARNEWICWVTTVKSAETRNAHIKRLAAEIIEGKKRPCCWPGCPHRNQSAENLSYSANYLQLSQVNTCFNGSHR